MPAWSPDGSRRGFASDHDGHDEIYVTLAPHASAGANVDGSNVTRLSDGAYDDAMPVWVPQ